MTINLGWYLDAGLTQPATEGDFVQAIDNSLPIQDKQFFLGDPDVTAIYLAASDPGTDQLTVTPTDPDLGDLIAVDQLVIGLLQADLDTNVPGDPINLGTQITGGGGNGVAVWARFLAQTGIVQGRYPINLVVNEVAKF